MNDLFLPFDRVLLGDSPHSSISSDLVDKILENIEHLKQSLHTSEDHQKLVRLSQVIHDAVAKLGQPQQGIKSEVAAQDSQALAPLVFAYVCEQRQEYFDKCLTYFRTVEDFFNAPASLLKAHGLSAAAIQNLASSASRKQLLNKIQRIAVFMREHRWAIIQSSTFPESAPSAARIQKDQKDLLPPLFFVRGDTTLLRRTKIAVVGDKLELPPTYHECVPFLIDHMKAMNLVPICNLSQQSSLQFALSAVRRGLPSILMLGVDMMRAFEKNYRFLNYFVDHGCLLQTSYMPLAEGRHTALQVFKTKMTLAKVILLFPKYYENHDVGEYSSKYWPVLNHCHQQDKMCLLYNPSQMNRVSQVLRSWESSESNLALYNSVHELRLIFQTLEVKGYLSRELCQKSIGALSNLTVLH